jgi:hypothetical protein
LAKAARDKKKTDMSKRQPSSKETKAYTAAVASNKAVAAAVSDSDYSSPTQRVMQPYGDVLAVCLQSQNGDMRHHHHPRVNVLSLW